MTREKVIDLLKKDKSQRGDCFLSDALDIAIKTLEQEQFINKACISTNVCKHDKEVALNNIKAEIKHNSKIFINEFGEKSLAIYEDDVFEIIDKYAK